MIAKLGTSGDYALVNGTFVFIKGQEHLKNRIGQRFKMFKGEYYIDPRQGIPYREQVFTDDPNLGAIKQLFREVLSTTPGVLSVQKLELSLDVATRVLSCDWEVIGLDGEPVTGQHKDFLVGGIETP